MSNSSIISELESIVDSNLESNRLYEFPFGAILGAIGLLAGYQYYKNRSVDIKLLAPLPYVFNKNLNFTSQSPEIVWEALDEFTKDDSYRESFRNLMECANLNIVFPYIHRNIYILSKQSEYNYLISYADEKTKHYEVVDAIISQLSGSYFLPDFNVDGKFYSYLDRCMNRSEKPDILTKVDFIRTIYNSLKGVAYKEESLVPDDFYNQVGFSSKDAFFNIRDAFCAIMHSYNLAIDYVLAKANGNDFPMAEHDFYSLILCITKQGYLKSKVLEVSGAAGKDYDIFAKFYFADEDKIEAITKSFLPPVWLLGKDVYFCPAISVSMLNVRNLLKSIKENKRYKEEYDYDGKISHMFEPMLIKRTVDILQAYDLKVSVGKSMPGSEIDLIAFSETDNIFLILQAKATLPPESAKEITHLSSRVVEACGQLKKFDCLSLEQQINVLSEAYPRVNIKSNPTIICGVLVNRGFGTYQSYKLMDDNDYVGLNCTILESVLSDGRGLNELSRRVSQYIDDRVEVAKVTDFMNEFGLSNVSIEQENIRFSEELLMKSKVDL